MAWMWSSSLMRKSNRQDLLRIVRTTKQTKETKTLDFKKHLPKTVSLKYTLVGETRAVHFINLAQMRSEQQLISRLSVRHGVCGCIFFFDKALLLHRQTVLERIKPEMSLLQHLDKQIKRHWPIWPNVTTPSSFLQFSTLKHGCTWVTGPGWTPKLPGEKKKSCETKRGTSVHLFF